MSKLKEKIEVLLRDERRALLTLLVVALVLRVGFVLVLNPNGYYFSDTRHYDAAARNLLDGNGFGPKYDRAPLYPLVMAGVYFVFGRSFLAMRLFEALLGLLLCYLIYRIARYYFSGKTALLAAAIAAIYPHFLLLIGILYPTNLFAVLLALSLYFLVKNIKSPSPVNVALSGFIAGLAALTVPAIFFIIPFWLCWLLFYSVKAFGKNLVYALVFVIALVVVLAPWTIRNYHIYGRLTLVQPVPHTVLPNLENLEAQKQEVASGFKSTVKYRQEHPMGTSEDSIVKMLLHYVKHPVATVKYVLSEMGHFWALYPDRLDTQNPEYRKTIHQRDQRMVTNTDKLWAVARVLSILVMAPVFFFALVGFFTSRPLQQFPLLLFLTIFGLSLGYSLIYAEVRYRIPVEPYVLMFTAAGVIKVFQWIFAGKRKSIGSTF